MTMQRTPTTPPPPLHVPPAESISMNDAPRRDMTTSRQHRPIGSTRIEGFPGSVDMVEASVVPRQRLHEGGDTHGSRRCRLRPRQEQAFTRHGRSHPTGQLVHPSIPLPTGRAAAIHWHRSHLRDQRQQHQASRQRKPILPPPQQHHRTNHHLPSSEPPAPPDNTCARVPPSPSRAWDGSGPAGPDRARSRAQIRPARSCSTPRPSTRPPSPPRARLLHLDLLDLAAAPPCSAALHCPAIATPAPLADAAAACPLSPPPSTGRGAATAAGVGGGSGQGRRDEGGLLLGFGSSSRAARAGATREASVVCVIWLSLTGKHSPFAQILVILFLKVLWTNITQFRIEVAVIIYV